MVERVRLTPQPRRVQEEQVNLPVVASTQRLGEAGPGRPRGSRNAMPARVAHMILDALGALGSDGKGADGVHGFLKQLFWDHPHLAAPLLHKMVPHTVQAKVIEESNVTHEHTHRPDAEQLARLTADELAALYRETLRSPLESESEPRSTAH